MLSTDFDHYFKDLEHCFLGVFSSDNYPKELKMYNFFIVNKDPSSEIGSHWMFVMLGERAIEFFDSCGTNADFVEKFLKFKNEYICVFNETQLQPVSSESCGEFCIYFAHERIKNLQQSFERVLNNCFTRNLNLNNSKVLLFCKQLFQQGNGFTSRSSTPNHHH